MPHTFRCEFCRWWDDSISDENGERSPCRVRPPIITIPGLPAGAWPFTDASDWCGELSLDQDKVDAARGEIDD